MSLPLVDLRAKITHETHSTLEAMSRAARKDRSEIVRDVMHEWAIKKIHEASLLDSLLKAEGLPGVTGVFLGNRGDSGCFKGNGVECRGGVV